MLSVRAISRIAMSSQQMLSVRTCTGIAGSGAGKGGGGGGSIREAGGAFGKMEAAREEQWARELQAEQLKHLHEHHHEEIAHHKAAIDRHKEAIKRHEQKIKLFSKDH